MPKGPGTYGSKRGRPPTKSDEELTKEITIQRVQAGSPSQPVSPEELAAKRKRQRSIKTATKVNSSTEYKRLGLCLAEAMGFKIDEIAAAVIAPVAKVAATLAAKKVVGKAKKKRGEDENAEVQEEKTQKTKPSSGDERAGELIMTIRKNAGYKGDDVKPLSTRKKKVQEGKIMNRYVKKLMEWKAGPIARRVASQSPAGAEGRMSKTKGKKISRDPVVDWEARKTQENVNRKLGGVKTNLKVKHAVQGSLNRRREQSRRGESVEGSPPLPRETKKDARADAAHSRKKVSDAGEQ